MENRIKDLYESPLTEVIEIRLEGTVAASLESVRNEGVTWSGDYYDGE